MQTDWVNYHFFFKKKKKKELLRFAGGIEVKCVRSRKNPMALHGCQFPFCAPFLDTISLPGDIRELDTHVHPGKVVHALPADDS